MTTASKFINLVEATSMAAPKVGVGTVKKAINGFDIGDTVNYVIIKGQLKFSNTKGTPKFVDINGSLTDYLNNEKSIEDTDKLNNLDSEFKTEK